ncbi:3-dehydroquinate synthase [Methylovirgula sp. 4M-Z18]|uniref:3-dehydroquinate synthase n=1 Tax=Methylovirgula sp. 4M-Z18 TaxID=2293567 RepID=UPI001FE16750|nr:3-dehydroquinate synthase [Methylovirgula sp. 4M-Z18]
MSHNPQPEAALLAALGARCIVLVGMMGSGKTSVGRRLAARLGLDFADADAEIEAAHRMTIPEIFARHGEPYFRDGERRVLARLLAEGPKVVATGGGAFMNAETRARIAELGVSIWLKADFDVLIRRVRRRANRPLLQTPDPEGALRKLIDDRYPTYALADVTVVSHDGPHEMVMAETMQALMSYLNVHPAPQARPAATEESLFMTKVRVDLGQRSYDILVGDAIIERAGAEIAKLRPRAACAIVTDSHVAHHHLAAFSQSLDAAGIRHVSVVVPPGEASKSYAHFAQVCDGILAARMERGDLVVALGGGVVGDLAGYAAASVRRGMDFVQVPTSLLAQVDSSVGGKTGINSPHGKNLVGAFHQPVLVLADTACLDTLPPREFRAGYAEVAKYGLIDNPDFFDWLETNWGQVFAGGPARQEAIRRSCAAKAAVVARDERETADRALLNLGHTFGHAFERLTGYDGTRLVHGEGVAIGMACAFRFSQKLGLCHGQDVTRVEAHLRNVGLPVHIRQIPGWNAPVEAVLDAMYQDKKVSRGTLTFILAHGIGQSFIAKNVAAEDVLAFLSEDMERI